MQYTQDLNVIRKLLSRYVPICDEDSSQDTASCYMSDLTYQCDYYILSWSPLYHDMFALIDELEDRNCLYLDHISLDDLLGHRFFYKIYRYKHKPPYKTLLTDLTSLKTL